MHAERDTGIVAWHGGGITSCREEHASRVGRAAKMSTGTGTGTAASKGEGSEEWLLRAIPYLSAQWLGLPGVQASTHLASERESTSGSRDHCSWCAHVAQLRVVTRLPIARAGCKWSPLALVHGGTA